MLLNVKHTTCYDYSQPFSYAIQRIRLMPYSAPNQKVRTWEVLVNDEKKLFSYRDGYGNYNHFIAVNTAQDTITITAKGEVETFDTSGILKDFHEMISPYFFLRKTPFTEPGKQLNSFIDTFRSISSENTLSLLHKIMQSIYETVEYIPGFTTVNTNAEEAFLYKKGVCQDYSHIFLTICRTLSIPARYISGYLFMDGHREQTASHAWIEAYVNGLGWVGFDATNCICPDEKYIRVACGLDYFDTSPIRGIHLGNGKEHLDVTIQITAK
ncbi:transglutaminase family protein [Entomobacter blattae]|uniref:Transglutaminase-like domain-containing protein n=1 Tax=Entomobacter blattae TaxID=2762277 RepID=A0A7H1NRN1_9PROT|nr:transglutaminase family protein [Entomobacter blattae]QNT78441.1 hypothetical protein JGUZn3_12150 [Entomobacter blattae]